MKVMNKQQMNKQQGGITTWDELNFYMNTFFVRPYETANQNKKDTPGVKTNKNKDFVS